MTDTTTNTGAASLSDETILAIEKQVAYLAKSRNDLTIKTVRECIDAAIAAGGAQEAVAWFIADDNGEVYRATGYEHERDQWRAVGHEVFPLYAAPLPRVAATVAMTDDQIVSIWEGMPDGASGFRKSWGYLQFARALLAAASTSANVAQSSLPEVTAVYRAASDCSYVGASEDIKCAWADGWNQCAQFTKGSHEGY